VLAELDRILLGLNLGLAFFLELAALGALAVLGHRIGGGGAASVVLAAVGRGALGAAFAAVVVANLALIAALS
jgi:hypothetical protein